jgi:hypothetical protein
MGKYAGKSQITSIKLQTNYNDQNPKFQTGRTGNSRWFVSVIEYCDFQPEADQPLAEEFIPK